MVQGRTVAMRVESQGQPVAGASIHEPESGEFWSTDLEGKATLRGLPPDTPLSFEVEAENHLPKEVTLPDGARDLRVVLEQGEALTFQVMDATRGTAIEEVTLNWRQRQAHHRRKVRGDGGRFALGGFQPGSLELSLEADGFRPTRDTDQPLADAVLVIPRRSPRGSLAARHFRQVHTARTDAQGNFRLSGLSPGSVCAEIRHPDLPPTPLVVTDLEASEERYLGPILLAGGQRVQGRVVDAGGHGLPETRVELRATDLYNPCLRQVTQSDADGYFELPKVAPGRYFAAVRGKQRLLAAQELEVKSAALDVGEIRVELRRFGGRVSVNGVPVHGGVVTFEASSAGFSPTPVFITYRGPGAGREQQLINDLGTLFGTGVDDDGNYATREVFSAREAVVTYRPADNGAEFRREIQVPASGEDFTLTEFTLDLDFAGESLVGHVLDTDDNLLAGVNIELLDAGVAVRSTRSGRDGEFLLPAAPPGPVDVRGTLGDLRGVARSEAGRRGSSLELVLTPETERVIVAEITDVEGQPLPTALGLLTDGDAVAVVRPADVAGKLRFGGLAPGLYKLVIACGTGLLEGPKIDLRSPLQFSANAPVFLECGDSIHNDVELGSERASQHTALLTSDGYPLAPLLAYLGRALVSDPLGRLALPPLAPSRWYLDLLDGTPPKRLRLDAEAEQIELQ